MSEELGKTDLEITFRAPDDFTEGYRGGYVEGYRAGMADGQILGFRDAKNRAFRVLDNDFDATKQLEAVLGEL